MKELELKVKGMMCNGCENRVQNILSTIEGVKQVIANHKEGTVKITFDEEVNKNEIKEKLEDMGYEVEK